MCNLRVLHKDNLNKLLFTNENLTFTGEYLIYECFFEAMRIGSLSSGCCSVLQCVAVCYSVFCSVPISSGGLEIDNHVAVFPYRMA